jgi:hypothetical protein
MSLNTVKALLILNAKIGWSKEARLKAALTRKARAKNKPVDASKRVGLIDSIKSSPSAQHNKTSAALTKALKDYHQAQRDKKPLKDLSKAVTKARDAHTKGIKERNKAAGIGQSKPVKKAAPKSKAPKAAKSTKVQFENMGGAGIAYKHPTKGYLSAYGGWTKNPDNAAVHGSKGEAKDAAATHIGREKRKKKR